jgi:ABC-type multidrug transport system fused ATPase/permease subunit
MTQPHSPTAIAELYRQVWAHAEGARARLVVALSMMGGSQMLKLALPWMAAQAINTIQTGGRAGMGDAALWIVAILSLHVGSWLLHGPARVLERSVALRVRRSVADSLYLKLVNAPLVWHEQHHSGDLQHRVGQASGALHSFTQTQFIYLQNLIQMVGPLLALWWLSSLTGALALAGFVLIGVAVLRFDRALMKLAMNENHASRRYAARLLDFVGNISAVASLRLHEATRALLDARLLAVFVPLSRSIVLTEWKWCAVDLLTIGLGWTLVVVYAAASLGAAGGTLLIGSLFMVYQYAQQTANVLCSMASNYQGLAHTQADYASADLLRRAPQQPVCELPPAPDWQSIKLCDIGFRHPSSDDGRERGGIAGVQLELRRGERLALVGPSGCGKSTLLRVLAGLYSAQQGHLEIDGMPHLHRRHAGELATLIPQEAEIFEATVRENLAFGQAVGDADLHQAVRASALDEVLASLPQGLDTPMSERGFNLSGGQRQRLALARGVLAARQSSLLLLDEPTSALDPMIEQEVQQRLGQAFAGTCLVAAVHRLTLLPHFDRVALMLAGRVLDVGTVAELQARQPLFAALCAGQCDATAAAALAQKA